MNNNQFVSVASNENNPNWELHIDRQDYLYSSIARC